MNVGAGAASIVVERGGETSHEELAAILLALTAILPETATSGRRRAGTGLSQPGWKQAALREALGGPVARCASDVAEPSPGVPPVFV